MMVVCGHAPTVRPRRCGRVKRWTLPRGEGAHCGGAGDRRVLAADPPERAHPAPLPRRRPARARDGGRRRPATATTAPTRSRPPRSSTACASSTSRCPTSSASCAPPTRVSAPTLVADHLQRLESELDRTRAAVASLRRLLRPDPAPLDVELRAVPADARWPRSRTTSSTTTSSPGTPAPWPSWTPSVTRADRRPGWRCTTTHCSRTAAGTCWCTGRRPAHRARGRVHAGRPCRPSELAVTTHVGEHDDIDVTYGELGAWVVANALVGGRAGPGDLPGRTPGHQPTRPRGAPRYEPRVRAARSGRRRRPPIPVGPGESMTSEPSASEVLPSRSKPQGAHTTTSGREPTASSHVIRLDRVPATPRVGSPPARVTISGIQWPARTAGRSTRAPARVVGSARHPRRDGGEPPGGTG